jgi:Na+/melibiose symporter-like transporter
MMREPLLPSADEAVPGQRRGSLQELEHEHEHEHGQQQEQEHGQPTSTNGPHVFTAFPSTRLSACRKLSFAVGGIPGPFTGIILTFYLSPFLLETARLRPASVGLIVLVGRICDAFTDPLVGALSDRTRSRIGRRRPWLFASVVPYAVSYLACFVTWEYFGVSLGSAANVWYYLVAYCLMQAITTCYSVPYGSLTMELSDDPLQRDAATAWRMIMELTATASGTVMQSLIIVFIAPEESSSDNDRQFAYLIGALVRERERAPPSVPHEPLNGHNAVHSGLG